MIFINRTTIPRHKSHEDTLNEIKKLLVTENCIIVNEHGAPLSDNDILHLITTQREIHFQTKNISDIERETLQELQHYLENAETEIEQLRENENVGEIVQAFQDIVEALFYFSKLQDYYQLSIIDLNQVQKLTQKSYDRMKESNTTYLMDVIEFELLPMIELLKEAIEERIIQ
jgi:hypothetical protein